MPSIPTRETLTVGFQSEPSAGIGMDDDGTASGVRSPKWLDPDKVAAFLIEHTVPPVMLRAELLYAQNGQPVMAVHVPAGRGLTATRDGRVIQRRMRLDKTPGNFPLYPQEYARALSDQGLLDFTDNVLPAAGIEDLDPNERARLRRVMETYQAEAALMELDDEELDKALGLVKQPRR